MIMSFKQRIIKFAPTGQLAPQHTGIHERKKWKWSLLVILYLWKKKSTFNYSIQKKKEKKREKLLITWLDKIGKKYSSCVAAFFGEAELAGSKLTTRSEGAQFSENALS